MPSRRRDVSKALDSRLPAGGRLLGIDSQEVVIVAGTLRNRPRLNILNNDGQPHPAENIAAILVLVSGLVSFVLGLVIRNSHTGPAAHIIATATGLAALLVGLYLQMVSSTRNQRVVIVAGIIAGFVGLAIGLSKGGFVGWYGVGRLGWASGPPRSRLGPCRASEPTSTLLTRSPRRSPSARTRSSSSSVTRRAGKAP